MVLSESYHQRKQRRAPLVAGNMNSSYLLECLPASGVALSANGTLLYIVNRFNAIAAANLPIPNKRYRTPSIKQSKPSPPVTAQLPIPPHDANKLCDSVPVVVSPLRRSKRSQKLSHKVLGS
jgi:hypothetical protein